MHRTLRTWFLKRLDLLLHEEQRRFPPHELGRFRVLVGAAALNLALALLNMFGPEAPAHGTLFRAAGILFSAAYLSTLILVRRGAPFRIPALLLCSALSVGIVFAIHLLGNPQAPTHAVIMLAPALAVYLLGARTGLVFTGVMALNTLFLYPWAQAGFRFDRPLFENEQSEMMSFFAAVTLFSGWGLSWLHSASRAEAFAALRASESRLAEMHRSLLEVSRQAGKAEMAIGVLHNMGNVLNSITVSMGLVAERSQALRLSGVARVAELLDAHAGELGTFLTEDPRGQQIPTYLRQLSRELAQEQETLVAEVHTLGRGIEDVRAMVSVQQEHARPIGLVEEVLVPQLIDDALRLMSASFERSGIHVRTEYSQVPAVEVDRYKLLQILTNLLTNAQQALEESARPDKGITVRVEHAPEGRLHVEVADNGVGIAPEHLPRVFTQGFTTRQAGHGFGLHLSSLTAQELGGSLTCESSGKEQGATFILELPLEAQGARESRA
ncbi:sensor histidine kinase [Hyalangium minutum]|nr:ATP-binding protein [Hyalangium minutum]